MIIPLATTKRKVSHGFTPPEKPGNDDSLVNTNQQWLPMVSKWCRISSIHSMLYVGVDMPFSHLSLGGGFPY